MTIKVYPFASGPGQTVTEADWRDMMSWFGLDGVVRGKLSEFDATPGTGLSVDIAPGHAWFLGHYLKSDATENIALQPADATSPRIDLIVAYVDMVNRTGGVKALTGTPAAVPVPPIVTKTPGVYWEIPLWEVTVAAGATSISASDIRDRRVYAHVEPQGHGGGLDADMVDGRHAAAGAWPGLMPLDKAAVDLPEGTADWLTIATATDNSAHCVFVLVEDGYGAIGLATVEAIGDTSGASRLHVRPGRVGAYVTAARIVDDGAGVLYLQVRADVPSDGNGARSLNVYMSSVNDGALWSFATAVPTTANVHITAVLRNGSWRLVRSLTGTGDIGWMTPSHKQQVFVDGGYGGAFSNVIFANCIDGDTATAGARIARGGTGYQIFDAQTVINLTQVRVTTTWWGHSISVYASNDGMNWTLLGSGGNGANIVFSRFAARYWKIEIQNNSVAYDSNFYEVDFYVSASITLRGVPVGSVVQAIATDGTMLESVRNEAYTYDAPVMLSTDAAQIAELRITHPDGTTPWLRYPTWAIDGGTLANGDVLTLYNEN